MVTIYSVANFQDITTAQTRLLWGLRAHLAATPALKGGGLSREFLWTRYDLHRRRSRISDRGATSFNMNWRTVIIVIHVTRTRLVHLTTIVPRTMDICQVCGPTVAKPTHAISDVVAIRRIRPNPSGFIQDILSPLVHPQVGSNLRSEVVIRPYRSLAARIGHTRTSVSPIQRQYLQYDAHISNTASMEQ